MSNYSYIQNKSENSEKKEKETSEDKKYSTCCARLIVPLKNLLLHVFIPHFPTL